MSRTFRWVIGLAAGLGFGAGCSGEEGAKTPGTGVPNMPG